MSRLLPILLLALALHLAAAEAPAHPDAPLTSPSGKLHLRLGDSTPLPGAIVPVAKGEGKGAGDGEDYPPQTLVLEEKGHPPFTITAPEGRCTPCWSADETYLALAIQKDRANFSLLILRLSDRKSITCDFTLVEQAWAKLLDTSGLTDPEKLAAAIGPSQLRSVRCTPQQCTGTLVSGTAQHTGTLTFAIDLAKQEWTPHGTLVQPRLTATELKRKE
jgi:hypothetical protein